MSFSTDFEIRQKLARSYQDVMEAQKAKYEQEKMKRIQSEQADLMRIQKQLDEENKALQERKRKIAALQYEDYMNSLEAKRLKELHNYEDKLRSTNVSLQMGSEQRVNQYKNYIAKLSDRVDNNAKNFNEYSQRQKSAKFLNPLTLHYSTEKDTNKTYNVDDINYIPTPYTGYLNKRGIQENMSANRAMGGDTGYGEYKEVNRNFDNYNRDLVAQNLKFKEEMNLKRKLEEETRKKEMAQYHQLLKEEKEFENEKKKQYREYLDSQMRRQIPEKLKNESYALNAAVTPNQFANDNLYKYDPDYYFLNKNQFVEVNPCKYKDIT